MSTRVEISKRLVAINSASAVLARLIDILVLVWLQQYLLRRISPEEYSLYPVLMSVMMFVPLLTTVLTSGLGRYIVESYAKGDEQGVTQITSTMFPLLLAAGVLMLCFGLIFAWYIGHILTIPPERLRDAQLMMGLLMFSTAIRLPLAPFGVGLYVHQKFMLSNCIRLVIEFMRIALLFILLFGISTRILWVVVASVSADSVSLVVNTFISLRLLPALKFRLNQIRWAMAKPLMSFGGWNFILNLADTIRTSADPIILNKLGTALDVTNFYLGSMFFNQIQMGSYLVRAPLQPPLTAMHAMGQKERLRNTYLRGGRYALWASLLLSLPLIIYRKEIITLYVGNHFITAASVMALLLAIFSVSYGNVMFSHIAYAKAVVRPWATRAIIIHSINLVLTLYLVGVLRMGAVGSALGTFIPSVVLLPLLYWPMGWRLADVRPRQWFKETVTPGFLPAVFAGCVWLGLHILVRPSSWLSLGLCALCGLVCYIGILLRFCLTAYEHKNLRLLLSKMRPWLAVLRNQF